MSQVLQLRGTIYQQIIQIDSQVVDEKASKYSVQLLLKSSWHIGKY